MSAREEIPPQIFTRRFFFYLVLAGFLLTLALWAMWKSSLNREVPDHLLGVWVTSEPAYKDRYLEISPVTISFGTGSGTESTGFIQKCEEVRDERSLFYRITYKSDDGEDKLFFSYDPLTKEIQLKNQQAFAWHKLISK